MINYFVIFNINKIWDDYVERGSYQGGLETDAFELKRMMRQEAHEKAFEIQVVAQRLYEKEKDKIVQAGLHQMNEEFDKKLTKLTQNLNIERSTKIN